MSEQLSSIIFKHGDDDYSMWTPDLTTDEHQQLMQLLEPYINNGESLRGTKQDILEELNDTL